MKKMESANIKIQLNIRIFLMAFFNQKQILFRK